jgi:tRNA (guanine37-N1)-methyltransferase
MRKNLKIDVMTLFPSFFEPFKELGVVGQAIQKELVSFQCHDIRAFSENRFGHIDRPPYGGGSGMVMMAPPLEACLKNIFENIKQKDGSEKPRVVFPSPRGRAFKQEEAKRLASYDHLVFVCGRYEGVDERFIESYVDEEISLGDFVLSGAEPAVMAISDACIRLLPGVLGNEESTLEESFEKGLLEYPQYTRPPEWKGLKVPEVLLSGDHRKIKNWREEKSKEITQTRRPDLWTSKSP